VRIELQQRMTLEEQETLSFDSLGTVLTDDGREIDFLLRFEFERSTRLEQQIDYQGDRALIDPLMINFDGGLVALSDQTFEFDLNLDGDSETIAQTARGSGFLVLDKNHNGIIDDGSEMFGPQTGLGFAELAQYDDDGNGWIDENDAVFQQLQIMTFANGEPLLLSLAEAGAGSNSGIGGIGAFYLGHAGDPSQAAGAYGLADYQLRDEQGTLLGSVRSSGVALSEDGQALMLQQIDLADQSQPQPLIDQTGGRLRAIPVVDPLAISGGMVLSATAVLNGAALQGGAGGMMLLAGSDFTLTAASANLTTDTDFTLAARFEFRASRAMQQSGVFAAADSQRMSSGNQAVSSSESARSWVNQVMVGYQRSHSDVAEDPAQAERQQVSLASANPFIDSEALQQQQADARLLRLRSMVEELKAMASADGQSVSGGLPSADDSHASINTSASAVTNTNAVTNTSANTSTGASGDWLALYRRIGRLSR
jgi:hypothetical protein